MKHVIVCDLDGTIVDIRTRDYAAYTEALAHAGLEPRPLAEFWHARRQGTRIVDLIAEADAHHRDAVLERFVAAVERDDMLALDTVLPDVRPFVAECRAAGREMVLCTLRRRPDGVHRQLERLGLTDLFDAVHVVEPGASKAAVLGSWPGARVAMIGDTEADITSARTAGSLACAVTTGLRSREYLEALEPDIVADSLTEVLLHLVSGTTPEPGAHHGKS